MQTKVKWYPSIKMLETNLYHQDANVNWNQPFELEEKLDGSNISFIKYRDQLFCWSRNQLISAQAFKDFDSFLDKWGALISQNLKNGEILNAEYIKQGRIKYVFDESAIPNLVLFDLGQVNQAWLDYVFNDGNEVDETKVNKIKFYPLIDLQQRFCNQPFKFATLKTITIKPVYNLERRLEDLIINCDGGQYRLSDQFEEFLKVNYFKSNSLIFNTTNAVEGVILKSSDGQIRLKYVFQDWKNLRKSKHKKSYRQDEIDPDLIVYLESQINDRWEKLLNYLYWNDETTNEFKGISNVKKHLQQNPQLIKSFLNPTVKSWMVNDICQELIPNTSFDQNYFKNNWQVINRLISQLMKRILRTWIGFDKQQDSEKQIDTKIGSKITHK